MAAETPKTEAPKTRTDEVISAAERDLLEIKAEAKDSYVDLSGKLHQVDQSMKRIQDEYNKATDDRDKARYQDALARGEQGKADLLAQMKKVGEQTVEAKKGVVERVGAEAKTLEDRAEEIKKIDTQIVELTKTIDDPNANAEAKAEALRTRADLTDKKTELEREGKQEEQEKQAKELREREKQFREEELKDIEKKTDDALAKAEEPEKPTGKKAGESTAEGEKLTLTDRWDNVSYGLAKGLATKPPQDAMEKFTAGAKALILRLFAGMGSPEVTWPGKINLPSEQEVLKRSIGLTFTNTNKTAEDGSALYTLDWVEPDPTYQPPKTIVMLTLKDSFGEQWPEAMSQLTDATTLEGAQADLAKFPNPDQGQAQMLFAAMEDAGCEKDAKVLAFLENKGAQVRKNVQEKKAATAEATPAPAEAETPTPAPAATAEPAPEPDPAAEPPPAVATAEPPASAEPALPAAPNP